MFVAKLTGKLEAAWLNNCRVYIACQLRWVERARARSYPLDNKLASSVRTVYACDGGWLASVLESKQA